MMRFLRSRNSLLDHFGGPKEAKIDQKSSSDDVKNEKSENVDCWYPSHQKSMSLGPNRRQDGTQMSLKSIFITIENDDRKMMLYREGSED